MATTEDDIRAQMNALLDFGVTKRKLAERLDVHESWLGRWLAGKKADVQVRPISVPELDRFKAYVQDFMRALQETHRPAQPVADEGRFRDTPARPSKSARRR